MKKTLIISLVGFVVTIISAIFIQSYLEKSSKELVNEIYDLIEIVDEDKINESIQIREKVQEKWDNTKNKWAALIDHEEIDNIEDIYKDKLEVLKYGLEQEFNFSTKHIPEEIIDSFVKEIKVCKDCFIWKLNFFPDDYEVNVEGRCNNYKVTQTELSSDETSQHRLLSTMEANRR